MPQIPFWPDQAAIPDIAAARPVDPSALSGPGDALAQGAGQLSGALDAFAARRAEGQRSLLAATATATADRQLGDLATTSSRIPNRDQAQASFDSGAAAIRQKILDGIADPLVRQHVDGQMAGMMAAHGTEVGRAAYVTEAASAQAGVEDQLRGLTQQYVGYGDGAAADAQRAQTRAAGMNLIDAWAKTYGTPAAGAQMKAQYGAEGDFGRVNSLIDQARMTGDPKAVEAAISATHTAGAYPYLTPEHMSRLQSRADGISLQLQAERDREAAQQDALRQSNAREVYTSQAAAIDGRGMPDMPMDVIRHQLVAGFGQEDGNKMADDLAARQTAYTDRTKVALTSPAEDQAILGHYDQGATYDPDKAVDRDNVTAQIAAKQKALQTDPAGYVGRAAPTVAAAWQAASADPSKIPQAAALQDTLLDHMGVPADGRPVLGKDQAKQMVASLTAGDPSQIGTRLQQLETDYGSYWDRVYGDLVKAKLPAQYKVAAQIADPATRGDYSRALATGDKTLKAAAGPTAEHDVNQALDGALDPMQRTLAYAPNGAQVLAEQRSAVKSLALFYASTGLGGAAAVQQATKKLYAQYDFADDNQAQARAPQGSLDTVESHAGAILSQLTADELSPKPAGQVGSSTGQSPADLQAAALASAKRGLWVNTPGDDGWMLLNAERQPVLRKDGTPVQFKYIDAGIMAPPTGRP